MEDKEYRNTIDKNYDNLTLVEQQELHKLFHDKESIGEIRSKLEKIIFRYPAPTPEDYLDHRNGWVTKAFSDSIYPHIKEDFLGILDPEKSYNQIVEYGAVRLGKSFLARLIIHYIIIYIHCLRHPQLYYGLAPTTDLSIFIISFVAEKANQLLLDPIYKILNMSPRFKQVTFQDKVSENQYKHGYDNIYWSKAGTGSKLTLESQLKLNIGTDFMSFLGADLLFMVVSEINFFIQKGGATHEDIFQLYTDGLARIKSTVGDNYLGMVFLDSSANFEKNIIEKYIIEELPKKEKVYFKQRAQWDDKPERHSIGTTKLPKWVKTGETFNICKGNNEFNAKIIDNPEELKDIPKNLILKIPIDLYDEFEVNILKSIKDCCGIPTREENKFINNINVILDIFDNKILQNVESSITADAMQLPDNLIWDKIHSTFFSKYNITNFAINRAHQEPRYIGIDLSSAVKGDPTGICVLHKEWSSERNCVIYVVDFCFTLLSGDNGINLEASTFFVLNLIQKGHLYVKQVCIDTWESGTLVQSLKRYKIDAVKQSVDRTLEPYQNLYTILLNKQLKSGRNIYLKNNLDSLITTTRKNKEVIDHSLGKVEHIYTGKFDSSIVGIHEKDCSDAVCQAFTGAFHDDTTKPLTIYEIENNKCNPEEDKSEIISSFYQKLHKFY